MTEKETRCSNCDALAAQVADLQASVVLLTEQIETVKEQLAKAKNCCKVTLEVLDNNVGAKRAYEKFGFGGYELDPESGKAVFWQKKISSE